MAIPIPQIPETPPSGAYLVNTLRCFDHAEHHSMLVHLTGRKGDSQCDDGQITWLSADRRLSKILAQRTIRAFPMFGIPQRAVCFTENSPAALEWLIAENRYEPFGLGFTKDTVFAHRGGPVLEVRGDEWPKTEFLPDVLRQ